MHGAWHGAWCFELLEQELQQRGESTLSMDLPIEDPELSASDYARVVADSLANVDDDVVLVGHSMGGVVIPLVAALRPVQRLIYLSGATPPTWADDRVQARRAAAHQHASTNVAGSSLTTTRRSSSSTTTSSPG